MRRSQVGCATDGHLDPLLPLPEYGSLRRVPQRIVNALPFGRDMIPEFAGTRQQVAQVISSGTASPRGSSTPVGLYWGFDENGRTDEDMHCRRADHVDLLDASRPDRRATVVDLIPELKRRGLDARDRWTLAAEDLDRIAADLWPGVHGPAPEVTTVKGKAPRKPSLTTEGRWALERIEKHAEGIVMGLGGLSERAPKGLAFEARRTGTIDNEALWRGIEGEAKRWEAFRAAERTGRGDWHAVVEVSKEDRDNPRILEHFAVAHVKAYRGRPQARGREGRMAQRRDDR